MNTLIYDFKRSFIRRSTIIMFVVFLLLGIGSTYLIFGNLLRSNIDPNIKTTVVATLWIKNGYVVVSGYIVDDTGEGLSDATIEFYMGDQKLASNKSLDNGYFELHIGLNLTLNPIDTRLFAERYQDLLHSSKLHVRTAGEEYDVKAMISGGYTAEGEAGLPASIVYVRKSVFIYETMQSIYTGRSPLSIIKYDEASGKAKILAATPFLFFDGIKYELSYTLSSASVFIRHAFGEINTSEACKASNYIGEFDDPVEIFDLDIRGADNTTLILCYKVDNQQRISMAQFSKSNILTAMYVSALTTPVNIVGFFIPISMLYIAYVLMAKPRSMGALEFVLARPITRFDMFINRYLAGVLTAVISAIIVVLALVLSSNILLGVPFIPSLVGLLVLGLILTLISMYSLYYALATSLRSGIYLGLSIGLFLLFSIFWQTIVAIYGFSTGIIFQSYEEYAKLLINSYYFNPMGTLSLIMTLIQYDYGISTDVKPEPLYIGLSATLWTIVPVILGYLRFKRMNLSS